MSVARNIAGLALGGILLGIGCEPVYNTLDDMMNLYHHIGGFADNLGNVLQATGIYMLYSSGYSLLKKTVGYSGIAVMGLGAALFTHGAAGPIEATMGGALDVAQFGSWSWEQFGDLVQMVGFGLGVYGAYGFVQELADEGAREETR